ncbi:hypothetical protein EMIT0P12_30752 [Pseudomonas sp. IT-P12]
MGASLLAMDMRPLQGVRPPALSLATLASKLAPTGDRVFSVGASLLAMDMRPLQGVRPPALSLATLASKPVPTGF